MIGWHYTSEACWERIRHEGLIPYQLAHPVILQQPCPRQGIWLYRERQHGLSHLGCLIWQMRNKRTTTLVLLKVQFSVTDMTFESTSWWDKGKQHTLSLKHDLSDDDMVYHTKVPATIVWRPIESRRIQLVARYDLVELVDSVIQPLPMVSTPELELTQ